VLFLTHLTFENIPRASKGSTENGGACHRKIKGFSVLLQIKKPPPSYTIDTVLSS
jgi:hypothetical protein